MPRKFIKRFLPDPQTIKEHKHLRMFGTALHDPNLWHLNRRSVSVAFAIGLFMAFVPMPFQMIPAAALAIYLRANLLVSIALVWISNPVTIPPIFYFCYLVGTMILGDTVNQFAFEVSWQWFRSELSLVWQPFLLGCLVVSTTASLAGYWGIQGVWRWHVVREWERRKLKKL
jgi:uncharacterized protein (DUF2062 family)